MRGIKFEFVLFAGFTIDVPVWQAISESPFRRGAAIKCKFLFDFGLSVM